MNNKGQVLPLLVLIGLIGTLIAAAIGLAVGINANDKSRQDTLDYVQATTNQATPIPEPGTLLLVSSALGAALLRRKK